MSLKEILLGIENKGSSGNADFKSVGEKFYTQVNELIKDFLGTINSEPSLILKYSWPDKLRCFFETFIGGWVVPRKGFKKDFPKKDIIPIAVNSIFAVIIFSTTLWSLFWVIRKLEIYFKYRFYY
jgi:hypothetical protein